MNTALMIIVAGISLTFIIVLMIIVVRQRKQIDKMKEASKPKYGFLGKPLYSFLVVGVLVAGFGITYFASRNIPDINVIADFKLEVELQTRIQAVNEKGTLVEFKVLPLFNEEPWGAGEEEMDVFWTITKGDEEFSEFELGLTRSNQGGFERVLSEGRYTVRADVIFRGRRFSESKTFVLQ